MTLTILKLKQPRRPLPVTPSICFPWHPDAANLSGAVSIDDALGMHLDLGRCLAAALGMQKNIPNIKSEKNKTSGLLNTISILQDGKASLGVIYSANPASHLDLSPSHKGPNHQK